MAEAERSQTVAHALDIVDALDRARPAGLTVTDLGRILGLHRTVVYRLLVTLAERDYVRRDDLGRYTLGMRLFALGQAVADGIELRRVALPHMLKLASATGLTALLTVMDANESVCVEKVDPAGVALRVASEVGRRVTLVAGASSKVLLAFQPPDVMRAVLARYEATLPDQEDPEAHRLLIRKLEEHRQSGYVFTSQELDEGLRGVAAPVRDHTGAVVAGLTAVGPLHRFPDQRVPDLAGTVINAANAISRDLGLTSET